MPGTVPTGRAAQVLAISVVSFERKLIRTQRIHWDYATLAGQLGLPGPPRSG